MFKEKIKAPVINGNRTTTWGSAQYRERQALSDQIWREQMANKKAFEEAERGRERVAFGVRADRANRNTKRQEAITRELSGWKRVSTIHDTRTGEEGVPDAGPLLYGAYFTDNRHLNNGRSKRATRNPLFSLNGRQKASNQSAEDYFDSRWGSKDKWGSVVNTVRRNKKFFLFPALLFGLTSISGVTTPTNLSGGAEKVVDAVATTGMLGFSGFAVAALFLFVRGLNRDEKSFFAGNKRFVLENTVHSGEDVY